MSLDILGPANADQAVTVRPTDDRTFGADDSWFKDCTSVDADDGTEYRASFFNGLLAQLRSIWRSNGGTVADPTIKIVPEIGSDDYGMLKAIQHLIQRGQIVYAADVGTVNAVVVTLAPALVEYKAGLTLRVALANTNSGAMTINVNGLGAKAVTRPDGSAMAARELVAGQVAELVYDGVAFQVVAGVVNTLSASRTYYVATTGSDANDGRSVGAAFRTIQKAINTVALFNLNGFSVTVNVADGTYAENVNLPAMSGTGSVILVGNTASPANCAVSPPSGPCFFGSGKSYQIKGFKVSTPVASATQQAFGFWCAGGGQWTLSNIECGYCADGHLVADNAQIVLSTSIRISGGGASHMYAVVSGSFRFDLLNTPTLTITTGVTFTNFATAIDLASIAVYYAAINNSGLVTGSKYSVVGNSLIDVGGRGSSYYPGSTAGATSSGGQYI